MSLITMVMLLASIGFLYIIVRSINKNHILFEQAFVWLVIGVVMIVISVFEVIPVVLARLFGFTLMSNFLLTLAIFFLLITVFLHSIQMSKQKAQLTLLVQELSMAKKRLMELENKNDQ